jgi:hypothetical protein
MTHELLEWAESRALARSTDPQTSVAAAGRIAPKADGLRGKFVEGVRLCGGQATAKEAANAVSDNPEVVDSVRKRARECVDRGYVRVVGQRACKISNQPASVYEEIV